MALDLRNMDCMKLMSEFPDKHFDLAIVDPPYGIQITKRGVLGSNNCGKVKDYGKREWDNEIPDRAYFEELKRVSKNQIIWGWNYFVTYLQPTQGYIVWDKENTGGYADCETAWTSFDRAARIYKHRWNGMLQKDMKNKEERIHPTQKPVGLYKWILKNYAEPGWKILDTHGGSMSIAVACHDYGFDLTLSEKDVDHFNDGFKRVSNHIAQISMF